MIARTDPDTTFGVLHQRIDKFGMNDPRISYETPLRPVKTIQSAAPGTDPEVAVTVLYHRCHEIAAETLRILGDIPVYIEIIPVIPVETIPGTKPHETLAVPQDGGHVIR